MPRISRFSRRPHRRPANGRPSPLPSTPRLRPPPRNRRPARVRLPRRRRPGRPPRPLRPLPRRLSSSPRPRARATSRRCAGLGRRSWTGWARSSAAPGHSWPPTPPWLASTGTP
ncbi:hypothetical protein C6401_16555 [Arthrobacter woluwensis]|nr:hypothetical protein C6401_16555 [Arthrobacter woluwensis]